MYATPQSNQGVTMQHFRQGVLAKSAMLAVTLVAVASTASAATASAATTASTTPRSHVASAKCDTGKFRKLPIKVKRSLHVPPTPTIQHVRTAKHPECGYDRLVLDVNGRIPGFTISFVKKVIADPSGNTIKLPGHRFVLITLRPARAHKASGASTISTKVHKLGFPMLKAWVLAGDDEGVVSFGIGLSSGTKVRVGTLPGRIFIDFKE